MRNQSKYQREYRKKNKEYLKLSHHNYYIKNKEILLKKHHIYYKKYWQFNKEKVNKAHRLHYKKTKGKWHKEYSKKNKVRILEMRYNNYHQIDRFEICKNKGKISQTYWTKQEDWILKKFYHKIPNCELVYLFDRKLKLHNLLTRAKRINLNLTIKKFCIKKNKLNLGKNYDEIYGVEKSKKIKKILSVKTKGKNNPSYINGKSKEPYSLDWNDNIKNIIRERDKKCVICHISREKHIKLFKRDLDVHHINGNKKCNIPSNLISLCGYHHRKIILFYLDLKDYFYHKLLSYYENSNI